MLQSLFALGIVGFEIEAAVDVAAGADGALWLVRKPTGRSRFRVLGVPMPWRAR
ncbi:MAG: hypothetical protein AB7I50_00530 [Vicinamibacterales bacterium]